MKKYIIAVGSPEISREVQEALFRAGFSWYSSGKNVTWAKSRFLCADSSDRHLSQSNISSGITGYIRDEGEILISSQEVIADPFQLDGATKPAKELTVAEISAKLGYDVKVVKG